MKEFRPKHEQTITLSYDNIRVDRAEAIQTVTAVHHEFVSSVIIANNLARLAFVAGYDFEESVLDKYINPMRQQILRDKGYKLLPYRDERELQPAMLKTAIAAQLIHADAPDDDDIMAYELREPFKDIVILPQLYKDNFAYIERDLSA